MKKNHLLLIGPLLCFIIGTVQAQYNILLNFNGTNGSIPHDDLLISGNTIYVTTGLGGTYSDGTVFSIHTDGGGYKDLFDFNYTDGYAVRPGVILSRNVLYGMTRGGGTDGDGIIFSVHTDGTGFRDLLDFNDTNGSSPWSELAYSGGFLYGMTPVGGAYGAGNIFRIDTNGSQYKDLFDFNDTNGLNPYGSLIISGKTMFGMTCYGGTYSDGNIFSIDTNGSGFRDLFDFNDTDGDNPFGNLLLSGEVLYGMTAYGGSSGSGNIFSIDTNGTNFINLFNFNGTNGYSPWGSLVLREDTLYGMTLSGGTNDEGAIFALSADGSVFRDMLNFSGANGADPWRSLTLSNSVLYGATVDGGMSNDGVIFSYTLLFSVTVNSISKVSCYGSSTGMVTANMVNGTAPYTYLWEPGGATTETVSGLSSGRYTVVVTDYTGDNASTSFTLTQPLAVKAKANVISGVTCYGGNNGIAVATATGGTLRIITTVAGNNTEGYSGDGGNATSAELDLPSGVLTDALGNLYIADEYNDAVRIVNSSGIINTFAGNNFAGYSGDGGPATDAELTAPTRLAKDASGNIYIADQGNNVIRIVNISGIINTFAGNGIAGYSGDGGPAASAELQGPIGLAMDASGDLYISDFDNDVIREVNTSGIINTVAGSYENYGYSGDGGPATAAELEDPVGLALDASGNLYIADRANQVIRIVNTSGIINTFTGNNFAGYSGDGGPATAAELYSPRGICFDASWNLYISDGLNNVIREVNTSGIISTYAGNGVKGYSGDGGPATAAEFYTPTDAAFDASGNLYIPDEHNTVVRKISDGNYTYLWSPAGGTNSTASNLSAGTYTVTISDNNGCAATASATIAQPAVFKINAITGYNVNCFAGTNGLAKVSAGGGLTPYTYSWSPDNSTTYLATGLSAGTYSVTVINRNGCSDTAGVTITQPAALRDSVLVTNTLCGGIAAIGVTGGTSPYTYTWSPDVSTTYIATGLMARSYVVLVKDDKSCYNRLDFSITQPGGMAITPNSIPDNGQCTGSAWVMVKGGTAPYTYSWTGGQTTDTIKNLCAGYYCSTIADANGCIDSVCITIALATAISQLGAESEGISVYPNPNNGQFTIQLSVVGSHCSVQIYNVLGECILIKALRSAQGENVINLCDKANGVYLYRVLKEDGSLVGEGKVVVQK